MKLLFLAFFLISFLAQTTQGGWGEKKCHNNVGRCRGDCKGNEKELSKCPNKKKCCVPKDKLPKDDADAPANGGSPLPPPSAGALTPPPGGAPEDSDGAEPAPPAAPESHAPPPPAAAPATPAHAPAAPATAAHADAAPAADHPETEAPAAAEADS